MKVTDKSGITAQDLIDDCSSGHQVSAYEMWTTLIPTKSQHHFRALEYLPEEDIKLPQYRKSSSWDYEENVSVKNVSACSMEHSDHFPGPSGWQLAFLKVDPSCSEEMSGDLGDSRVNSTIEKHTQSALGGRKGCVWTWLLHKFHD